MRCLPAREGHQMRRARARGKMLSVGPGAEGCLCSAELRHICKYKTSSSPLLLARPSRGTGLSLQDDKAPTHGMLVGRLRQS